MVILGKVRNREEKRIRAEKEKIQADYETEKGDTPTKRYVKKYTTKEWNRFSEAKKQILTNRYHVILTDHETRKEKLVRRAKQINLKNFDKGMRKFDKAQDTFWREWDKGFNKAGVKKTNMSVLGSSKGNNTDKIFGGKKSKVKIF